ncbi:MAG: hypothetical protein P4L27_14555 [Ignavibacteriaceae bacterium]|nr:hypothetical protein [Ignavibacteriaceae bacterium]
MGYRVSVLLKILFLIAIVLLLQSCGRSKVETQAYVDNYTRIINDMKSQARIEIIKRGSEAIISYRKSGLLDVDAAERAQNSLIEGIRLDSISLQNAIALKSPDAKTKEITNELVKGINSIIEGNIIFASNYSKAKDQNVEERKLTIINVRPGMKFLAEGLNSEVSSIGSLQIYIKDNNLKGGEDIAHWYTVFKMESDNIREFLKN